MYTCDPSFEFTKQAQFQAVKKGTKRWTASIRLNLFSGFRIYFHDLAIWFCLFHIIFSVIVHHGFFAINLIRILDEFQSQFAHKYIFSVCCDNNENVNNNRRISGNVVCSYCLCGAAAGNPVCVFFIIHAIFENALQLENISVTKIISTLLHYI